MDKLNGEAFARALIAYAEVADHDQTTAGKVHALRAAIAAYDKARGLNEMTLKALNDNITALRIELQEARPRDTS